MFLGIKDESKTNQRRYKDVRERPRYVFEAKLIGACLGNGSLIHWITNGKYTFLHAGVNSSQPHISINLSELIGRIIPQQVFRKVEPHLPLIESLLYAHKTVSLSR